MLNRIRINDLGPSGVTYLATATRSMLAVLTAAHSRYAPREAGLKSTFVTLKKVLLEGLSKVASTRPYKRLGCLETILVRTALGAALKAAESHQESNAILGLQRLKRVIPAARIALNQREQAARFLIRLFVTSKGFLTTLVRAEVHGTDVEAA
jgi:hypothetical protein